MSGKNKKKHMLVGAAAIALFAAALSAGQALSRIRAGKTDTAKGLAYIRQAEGADIQAVRHKIKTLGEKDREEGKGRHPEESDYRIIFEDSVIMGDSIPEGLREYGFLNASSVTAGAGVGVDGQIELLNRLCPEIIFIYYGTDEITGGRGDMGKFISGCANVLDSVAKALPDSKIFVNSIFPVRADTAAKEPKLEYLSMYNKGLQELCDKRNIAFIDNTDLAAEEFYEDDGIHFKPDFYPRWLDRMRKVAELWP